MQNTQIKLQNFEIKILNLLIRMRASLQLFRVNLDCDAIVREFVTKLADWIQYVQSYLNVFALFAFTPVMLRLGVGLREGASVCSL